MSLPMLGPPSQGALQANETTAQRPLGQLWSRVTLMLLWGVSVFGAYHMWRTFSQFIFEDAYITYRYAENIAAGRGFVFTPGERVLGTTAPLYTLLLAGLKWLGLDVVATANLIYAASAGWIAVCGGLMLRAQGALVVALLFAVIAISGGPELQRYMGMETALLTAVTMSAFWAALARRDLLASILIAAAFLIRYDAAAFAVLYFALVAVRDRRIPWKHGFIALGLVLPWLIFAQLYFGSVLPNTLGAKTGDTAALDFIAYVPGAQWLLGWRFVHFITEGQLPASAHLVGQGILAFGWLLGLIYGIRKQPAVLLLLLSPIALVVIYGLIGPNLGFLWYATPGVFLALLLSHLGWAQLSKNRASNVILGALILPVVAIGTVSLPGHFDAHVGARMKNAMYRSRAWAYGEMADWVQKAKLQDLTLATREPGYFVYRTGNPAVDMAGLVSKGIYYHGDAGRKTTTAQIIQRFEPDLLVTLGGYVPQGYVDVHSGSPSFQLAMKREVFAERLSEVVAAHTEIGDLVMPEMTSPFHHDLGKGGRELWARLGGFGARETKQIPFEFDGAPYDEPYMYLAPGRIGVETPSFAIDFDRLDFHMAAVRSHRMCAQLVVDGRVAAVVLGRMAPGTKVISEESLDVSAWRGRVGVLRFVHREKAKDGVAFDHIRSANDSSRRVLTRFGEGPGELGWSKTFGTDRASAHDLLLRYGVGIAATGDFAGSAGLTGEQCQLSEPFVIDEDELRLTHLNFGGEGTRIRLRVDGEVVHEKVGDRRGIREAVRFDTSPFRGQEAQLELVDTSRDPWDWIGIDDVVLATD